MRKGLTISDLALLGSVSAVGPTSPDQLANLVRWYRADSFSLADTDPIGGVGNEWTDESVSGADAVQTVAGNRPTYRTNIYGSMPAIQFNSGIGQYLTMATLAVPGIYTVIAVGQTSVDSDVFGLFGVNIQIRIRPASNTIIADSDPGGLFTESDVFSGVANSLRMMTWRRNSGAFISFREQNIDRGTYAAPEGLNPFSLDLIGATDSGNFLNGYLAELCIYQQDHSDFNINSLCQNYFRVRYPGLP